MSRDKVTLYEGEKRTAAGHGLNMLLAACAGEISSGNEEERPELYGIALMAMKPQGAGGGADDETKRTMDAVMEATIQYSWCQRRNGMRLSQDRVWLLMENAIPHRAPRAEDFDLTGPSSVEASRHGGSARGNQKEDRPRQSRDGEHDGADHSRGERGGGKEPGDDQPTPQGELTSLDWAQTLARIRTRKVPLRYRHMYAGVE